MQKDAEVSIESIRSIHDKEIDRLKVAATELGEKLVAATSAGATAKEELQECLADSSQKNTIIESCEEERNTAMSNAEEKAAFLLSLETRMTVMNATLRKKFMDCQARIQVSKPESEQNVSSECRS
jgi:hypothetical protein